MQIFLFFVFFLAMDERERAKKLALDGHNLVLTGSVGRGKTATLGSIDQSLQGEGRSVAVTALTGLASQQIKGMSFSICWPLYIESVHLPESHMNNLRFCHLKLLAFVIEIK